MIPRKRAKIMSNSQLVDYTLISPYKDVMTNKVNRKITIHHMAGNLSVETCGNVFQTRRASANYGIGSDGRVGLYVEERDRSWASSSADNDKQAITIEVANDGGANWHVSDKAFDKLIDLCVDICERNDIKELVWTGDKTGTLTVHRFFAATACPGDYLFSKMPEIAEEVNKRLAPKKADEWKYNNKGYWYEYADGSYPMSEWKKLDGEWYYFNEKGYAMSNAWLKYKDKWYYFGADRKMKANDWIEYKGKTYYVGKNGDMLVGLQEIHGAKYYFANDGHMCRTNPTGALE